MNRRTFIKVAGSAAALPSAAVVIGNSPTQAHCSTNAVRVVVDAALEESVALARKAILAGAHAVELRCDIAALWYTELASEPAMILGVLRPSDAFVLKRLVKGAGRSVIETSSNERAVALTIVDARVHARAPR